MALKKSHGLSLRRSRLGVESLEDRRVLAVFINELMLNPLFGDESTDQYVEIRNDDLGPIPANTYLVFVDGDDIDTGEVHTIFDLSGIPTGSNGILSVLQEGHPFTPDADGHAIVSTSEEFSGLPSGVFRNNHPLSERIDFIVGSNTAMLIESATPPTLGTDIDTSDDGIADALPASWTVLDSISLLRLDGFGYSDLAFHESTTASNVSSHPNPISAEGIGYAGRIQDSTGHTADDWVVGEVQQFDEGGQRVFRFTHGIFGNPEPTWFAGRYIDHVGQSNFHGGISGQVTRNGAPAQNTMVYVDENSNGVMDDVMYSVRPEDFSMDQELTNEAPRATLLVAEADGTPGTAQVLANSRDPNPTVPSIFSSGGIPWFSSTGPLRIDFPELANSVTAEFRGRGTTFGRLEVFDATGQSLQMLRTNELSTDEMESITINRGQADIAYALAYSDDTFNDSSPFGTVSELHYRIPEHRDVSDADGNYRIDYLESGSYEIRAEGSAASVSRTIGTTEHVRGSNFALDGRVSNTGTGTGSGTGTGTGTGTGSGSGAGQSDPISPGLLTPFFVSSLDSGALPPPPAGTFIEDGDTVRIEGTAVTDEVHVAAGLTEHVITVNGESRTFSAATFDKIDIKTLGGVDVVTVVGTSLDDQADLLATHGKFVSSDYHITFSGAETISVYGGDGGLDKAVLADSVGDDVFLGSASFASMREITNTYRNEARGFDIITGNSVLGGNDQALVFGTAGSDHIKVFPEFAQMTRGAGNTEFRANKFERFEARGEGGIDMAEFVDSVGNDHITLEFHQAEMIGTGYANKVTDFDTIHARANRGGTDSATFFDSAGDDTLNIRPAKAMYMQGPGFENRIWGFDTTESFANGGGTDDSFLYDTAGNDVFIARPTTSLMRGTIAGEAYEHVTHNFETMTGHAMYAGFDAAFIYDGAADDNLIVRPDFVEQQGANGSFKHRLLDFQTVVAYADAGGNDTATFLDTSVFSSDPTNDVFKSTPTRSSLEQPGTLFRKTAEGYETVTAISTTGTDVAEFVDVGSAEQLNGSGAIASIAGRNTTANGFGHVRATNKAGETPTADIDTVSYVFEQLGQWNNI